MHRAQGTCHRVLLVAGLMGLLCLVPPVDAHAFLDASAPPANGHVAAGSTVVALRFAETVDLPYTEVVLADADGARMSVTLDRPPLRPDEVRVLTAPLADGVYDLRWQALSVDGHPEAGRFRFAVGDATVTEPLPVVAREARPEQAEETTAEGVTRGLFLFTVLALMGGIYHALEVDRLRQVPRRVVAATTVAAGIATVTGLLLFVLMARRIDASLGATVHTVGGAVLLVKAGLAGIGLTASVVAWASSDKVRRRGLFFVGLAALFVVFVHSFGGHGVASGSGETDEAHTVLWTGFFHLIAVAVWVGGLLALVVLGPGRSRQELGAMIKRFSPWALVSVVVLAGTGLFYAYGQLVAPADLWRSAYGRWILAKTAGFVVLLGFGAWHQKRAGPRLRAGGHGRRAFRRSTGAETVVMLGVVLLAGLLAATPVPAPAVATEDLPLRAFEAHEVEGDHRVHLAVLPDPLVVGVERTVRIELRSETFSGYDEDAVSIRLEPPENLTGEAGHGPLLMPQRVADGRYEAADLVFGAAGDWTFQVTVTNRQGTATVPFVVPVQPEH